MDPTDVAWDLLVSGPADARQTVLLLPGGLNPARSYAEVMAEPVLAGTRLVAATLPGHCGTEPLEDFAIGTAARHAARLADEQSSDVVVGFSMGATVALEMVATGAFTGPTVLLGISLSPADEPAFFRAVCRLGDVLGPLPAAALLKLMGPASKGMRVSPERRAEMLGDLRSNDPRVVRRILRGYLDHLGAHARPAARLCAAGVPVWVVHAEKGDGGLTTEERRTLEACPHAKLVTIPGTSYFLPGEEPRRIADVVVEALAVAGPGQH
ncbi:alpha/beta fold hydrolase [Kitasatospora sp. DSM 101779]|uniref:alpha/beta fold hydrolase n=1 Tax=Kitasatospora sp. DSM 101779 TaxID=2853165 RepID=UPI0021D881FC|nr:alpha/beta hydrolase [Kitasatospora sp. DSM 101779]MCU7820248.1 alpha/beta hydrolase [Kitasatospora sp. DSM 101779]